MGEKGKPGFWFRVVLEVLFETYRGVHIGRGACRVAWRHRKAIPSATGVQGMPLYTYLTA